LKVQIAEAFKPLFKPKRYKVYYGGRGGAKSWAFAQALLIMAAQKKMRILCTREIQGSIRESVHRLLADTVDRLGLSGFYEVQQQTIYGKNGSQFIFEGLRNNVTKIKSMEAVDIVWCEEAEAITDHSWEILIPTIRKKGSEIWISFNPANELDPTYQRFVLPHLEESKEGYDGEHVYCRKVSWRDNPWFPEELKAEMEMLKEADHNKYLHIWEGECRLAVDGAIYQEQLTKAKADGRICSIPVESSVLVNTFWDLGRNDSTAIWFHQRVGRENRFIDYYEARLVGLDHYATVLRDRGYQYEEHYLPHDVDISELSTNTTRRETLENLGVRPISVVPRISNVNEGIEQTRQAFASCWFDKDRCAEGIRALSNYQYAFDERYNVFRQTPLHNWASNGADAFRQFGQGYDRTGGDYWKPIEYPERRVV